MKKPTHKLVGVNAAGRRVGETHSNAKLSDKEVDAIRDLHEEEGWGYKRLAKRFKSSVRTIRSICAYERRSQFAERWRRVSI